MLKLKKITIKGDLAHFKIPAKSKYQLTFDIPPISTVVGILQNIFGKKIDNFILGYTITYSSKHKDLMKIYKELNLSEKRATDSDRFKSEVCIVEYLYNVVLTIYTDIDKEILLEDVLVLGKTNCLATLSSISEVELVKKSGYGYNQYTHKDIGEGIIRRINTLTKFNELTDMYDITSDIVRENIEFKYDKNYDSDLGQNIYLWKWNGGKISAFN